MLPLRPNFAREVFVTIGYSFIKDYDRMVIFKFMKNIIFIILLLTALNFPLGSYTQACAADLPAEKQQQNKKKSAPMPITPGSQVIQFKDNIKAEIRPDKSVWWFGANYKKAIVADGVHELKDGQKITTKGGNLVGKNPRPQTVL
jgi:hypothetical protein